ncbi:hypothetical protein PAHAL_7G134500 [Panicum hallii]|uniref:Uncharacterized protein n=1 Tax=Panicum hallii TaxID=206008 RepID=A0A2T8IC42_9POAL|nr:hypothetical protein PAHAL_7G134500 [Panicum hallii]PVH35242.1 hypothetical protein PAHAL_7G134500 [Panicum hallii]PVH35245.1 hypothetical protein PAHAL_7G134500 [Panicum hallii]PVH35246.1 hypothetical protein PAHAL_7G134500 [Panicum hallii]
MGGGHRLRGGPWALLAWATGRASDASKCRSCSSLPCSQGYSSPADLDDVPESSMICSGARMWSRLVSSRIFSIGMDLLPQRPRPRLSFPSWLATDEGYPERSLHC